MTADRDRLVSVVVTVYNGAPYLAEAIDSVVAQTHQPVELIVLDDGSTDGSGEIALGYGESLRYARQERGGIGVARNAAVELAQGRYLAFLDADDRFVPTKLESQLALLDEDPGLDMVFGRITEFVSPDLDESAKALLRAPVHDEPWRMTNLMLIRRESYDRVGPFSTTLRVGVGVEWYTRALEAGLREAIAPLVVLERRLHASNNGIQERDARLQYLHVLKQSLDRRREQAARSESHDDPAGAA
jgi:glycosyltransferase involved in cell wall biosynthesis